MIDTFPAGPAWGHTAPPHLLRRHASLHSQSLIYTTNAIESLNMQLRKIIKTRGHFPTDESAIKLLWLALRNVLNKSVRGAFHWKSAMNQLPSCMAIGLHWSGTDETD